MRLLLIILALSFSASIFAQQNLLRNDTIFADSDMPTMSTKVSMEIDMKLFPRTQGNMFISENPRAMIMPMVLRADFETLDQEELLNSTAKELDITIKKKGVMKNKGKKAYYIIGSTNDKERNIQLEVYFVNGYKNSTIMITGFYDLAIKKAYKNAIKKAAFSAILN